MGDIVFDRVVVPGVVPTTEVPGVVMAGAGVAVVGASCMGACWMFPKDGAVTAGKLLEGAVELTGAGI